MESKRHYWSLKNKPVSSQFELLQFEKIDIDIETHV